MLDEAVTELETCRSGLSVAEEGVIAKDIHGVQATEAAGMLSEHLHAQAIPKQRTVVEAARVYWRPGLGTASNQQLLPCICMH